MPPVYPISACRGKRSVEKTPQQKTQLLAKYSLFSLFCAKQVALFHDLLCLPSRQHKEVDGIISLNFIHKVTQRNGPMHLNSQTKYNVSFRAQRSVVPSFPSVYEVMSLDINYVPMTRLLAIFGVVAL